MTATTVPAAHVNINYADCNCGATLHILTGQVAANCSFCGGSYPIPTDLAYGESRLIESVKHHKAPALCTVEDGPNW